MLTQTILDLCYSRRNSFRITNREQVTFGPDHRFLEPFTAINRVISKPTTNTNLIPRERVNSFRSNNYWSIFGTYLIARPIRKSASYRTRITNRAGPVISSTVPFIWFFHQRRGRTNIDTSTTKITIAFMYLGTCTKCDHR